jgi:hypothetical protein
VGIAKMVSIFLRKKVRIIKKNGMDLLRHTKRRRISHKKRVAGSNNTGAVWSENIPEESEIGSDRLPVILLSRDVILLPITVYGRFFLFNNSLIVSSKVTGEFPLFLINPALYLCNSV